MYKVMLADDEKLILNGIKHIIDWESLDLEVVAMATNGEEALRAFKETPVEIVITDINMPKVDGLTLIKEIKAIHQDVKFIILSGHDEFNYAREAIKLGVESYILKPIDEEELEKILRQTIKKLKDVDKHRSELIHKHNKILKFLESEGKEEISQWSGLFNIQTEANCYTMASLVLDKQNRDEEQVSRTIQAIQDNNIRTYPKNNQLEIFYNMPDTIILINSWRDESEDTMKAYYHAMQTYVEEVAKVDVFLTLGTCVHTIEELPKCYREIKQFQKYVVIKGYNSFVDITEADGIDTHTIMLDTVKLHKYIIEGNEEIAQAYLEEVFNEVKNEGVTLENVYQIVIKLAMLLQEVVSDFKLEKMSHIKGVTELLADIYTAHDFIILKNIFLEEIRDIIQLVNADEVRYTPVVQQVVNYIHENYWEDMNLKTLAHKYNINTSYLGQIFLKEVGHSFSQYLSDIKNSKAKELILNTNMRINDIAKAVGYTDTSYFYRKFKKHYGVSPATLREIKKY